MRKVAILIFFPDGGDGVCRSAIKLNL